MRSECGLPPFFSRFRFHVRVVSGPSRAAWVPHACASGRQLGRRVPDTASHLYSVSAVFPVAGRGSGGVVESGKEQEGCSGNFCVLVYWLHHQMVFIRSV